MGKDEESFFTKLKNSTKKKIGETRKNFSGEKSKSTWNTNPIDVIDNQWDHFIKKVWIFIGYLFMTMIVLQLDSISGFFALLGFLMMIGIPIVAIILLLSLLPTIRIGKYTFFSRNMLSVKNQVRHSGKIGKFFFKRLYEISPEIVLIIGFFSLILIISILSTLMRVLT